MPDMTCPRCGEPSDTHHVRHDMTAPLAPFMYADRTAIITDGDVEAALELLPDTMPEDLRTLTEAALFAEVKVENILRSPHRPIPDSVFDPAEAAQQSTAEAWRKEMYRIGLAHGCDCCLFEPDNRTDDPENLRTALFDSAWDGDPGELFI